MLLNNVSVLLNKPYALELASLPGAAEMPALGVPAAAPASAVQEELGQVRAEVKAASTDANGESAACALAWLRITGRRP
jgi:hypothetical protein